MMEEKIKRLINERFKDYGITGEMIELRKKYREKISEFVTENEKEYTDEVELLAKALASADDAFSGDWKEKPLNKQNPLAVKRVKTSVNQKKEAKKIITNNKAPFLMTGVLAVTLGLIGLIIYLSTESIVFITLFSTAIPLASSVFLAVTYWVMLKKTNLWINLSIAPAAAMFIGFLLAVLLPQIKYVWIIFIAAALIEIFVILGDKT